MNTGAPLPHLDEAHQRVLKIQTKLHRWSTDDPNRRFDDLYNLVMDPAVLLIAWERVRSNRGARTAGVDGDTAFYVQSIRGVRPFLVGIRADLKARTFRPLPVRERMIPKASGKYRRLGIPTVRDRVVQAALKLVLEPILEADFKPCSYGFRPRRRAQDAIAEIHYLCSRSYEWVLEGDITACFDEIDHTALMRRIRDRIGDKRVLALVKAFLKAGILTEGGAQKDATTGTPQGGILSPLLANIALTTLDEHFVEAWAHMGDQTERRRRRRNGLPNYRLVRYADDFVVLVSGDRAHVEQLREEVAMVLQPMGLRLSEDKTAITHIDKGFDFLGWHIKRQQKRGATKRYVYTYPSKAALAAIRRKVRTITRGATDLPLATVLHRLNPVLRGWANYFRHGVSSRTFGYLSSYVWHRVATWLRHKYRRPSWKFLYRRYQLRSGPADGAVTLFNISTVSTTRYRYRGTVIPTPWS